MEHKELISTGQAAKVAGVSKSLINQAVRAGSIRSTEIAGRYLINPSDLEEWNAARLARGRGRPAKPAPVNYAIPLIGAVGAGPGQDDPFPTGTMLSVHELFAGDVAAYQVRGRSMEAELIGFGDYVIVRRQPSPDSGEKVVAWIKDDDGMVVRRLRIDADGSRWFEAAPKDGPRYRKPVQAGDVIYGVYCGIVRRVDVDGKKSAGKRKSTP
ncbi:MAG: excisionase family DNA-binding protein [Bacteroidales bacterium]|nr:excisionase family DNA-binding protein [Bacteroidales bacterium]